MNWLGRWLRTRREKRTAGRAFFFFTYGDRGFPGIVDDVGRVHRDLQPGVWANLGLRFANEGKDNRLALRCLHESVKLDPQRDEAQLLLAKLEVEEGLHAQAIDRYRDLCKRYPKVVSMAQALACLCFEEGRFEEVVDQLLLLSASLSAESALVLGKALYALGRMAEVVALLEPVGESLHRELQGILSRDQHRQVSKDYEEVSALYQDAVAHTRGREKVIESRLVRRDLDAHAGVNYSLLGEARMASSPRWEVDHRLRDVAGTRAYARQLMDSGEESRGLCHQGVAHLREWQADKAKDCFERARDLDDDNFAAYLGLGAAMNLDSRSSRVRSLLRECEVLQPCEGLTDVVTEYGLLTPDERQATCMATQALAGLVPYVAAAKGRARILPIDARPVDLPEIAEIEAALGEDRDPWDQRTAKAITGLATARVCAAKIEGFLDVARGGWAFAHEFAHLVHFHAPREVCDRIEEFYRRFLDEEHLLTVYETKNVAEFFAVSYEDYLAKRWNLPRMREGEDEDLVLELFEFFDTLASKSFDAGR